MFERLKEDMRTILERDPAAQSPAQVLFCYPGLHALAFHRAAHWCWVQGWGGFARWLSHVGRFLTGIEIHPGARIGRRVFIDHGMGVVIGETAEVGDDCTIYHGVTLGGLNLGRGVKRHPTIGKGVIIGAGAKILGNFTVGDNARIGSNAVVVKPVAADTTVVGVPARATKETSRAKVEAHANFKAYAVVQGEDDPYATRIRELEKAIKDQAQIIEELKQMIGAGVVQDSPKEGSGQNGDAAPAAGRRASRSQRRRSQAMASGAAATVRAPEAAATEESSDAEQTPAASSRKSPRRARMTPQEKRIAKARAKIEAARKALENKHAKAAEDSDAPQGPKDEKDKMSAQVQGSADAPAAAGGEPAASALSVPPQEPAQEPTKEPAQEPESPQQISQDAAGPADSSLGAQGEEGGKPQQGSQQGAN